jgi:hypothetical protein
MDDCWCVEAEDRVVQPPSQIGMLMQKTAHGAGVVPTKGIMQAFLGHKHF